MISGISQGATQFHQMQQAPPPRRPNFDINGDQSVDQTELNTFINNVNEKQGTSLDAEKIMSSIDSDENGELNSEEITEIRNFMPKPPNMNSSRPPRHIAKMLENGSADSEEFTNFIEDINSKTGSDLSSEILMKKLDSDGDRALNGDEIKSLKRELPKPPGPPKSQFASAIQNYSSQSIQNYNNTESQFDFAV